MYLSRLVLNSRSRDVRAWLTDCHALHRVLMFGFPTVTTGAARAELGVLYRVEQMEEPPAIPVLVQSRQAPRWDMPSEALLSVDPPKPLDALLAGIAASRGYRFRLRANPTRRVHKRSILDGDPEKGRRFAEKPESEGKRVELRSEEDQLHWLARRGNAAGFALLTTRLLPADRDVFAAWANPGGALNGKSSSQQRLTLGTVLFEGILRVTDAVRFRDALAEGIGPGKAFGCSLLSIAATTR